MFLSEDAFNKYSIFGKFENHIKYSIFKQDHEDDTKFEVLPFLNYCENNTKWYHTLMDVMIDKEIKLASQDEVKKSIMQQQPMSFASNSITQQVKTDEFISTKEIAQKSKKEQPITKQDQKTLNIMKNWYPLRFKLNYPRKSSLSAYEQKDFIDLYKKFQNRTHLSQKEIKYYRLYVHYRNLIEKERVAFFEYAKQYFTHANEDYQFVNETTVQYIEEMISYLEHQPTQFSKYFTKIDELSIDHADLNKANFELEKILVQLGNIPKVILPSTNAQPSLTIAYTAISKRAPVGKNYKKMSKIRIFEDPNAEKLALKYQANIVMTNSSFVHLMYHLSKQNNEELKIPIMIKNLTNSDDNTPHKIVFIDKPFISNQLNQRDKNDKFYKRSLMVTLVKHQIVTRNYKKPQNLSNQLSNESRDHHQLDHSTDERKDLEPRETNVNYEIENKLESFGVFSEKPKVDESLPVVNVITKKRPIESPRKSIEMESKKFKQDEPSPNSSVKEQIEKKLNESQDKDYQDYDSDSENGGLQIVTDTVNNDSNNNSKNTSYSAPASPVNEQPDKKEAISEPSPEEPDLSNYNELNIKPMVIPLEKLPENKEKVEKIEPESKQQTQQTSTTSVTEAKKSTEDSKDSNLTLLDLISKMQEKLITASNTVNKTPVQHILSNLAPNAKPTHQPTENVKDYTYIENIHENVNYNLWIIHGPKPIRILIRSSTTGYVNTESSSRSSVVLHSKLEYQPQFGCEKLTHKDYCFMWSKSFVRNLSDVILCRINVFTNKLINVRSLNHKDILIGCTTFNPQSSFNYLRNLFQKLLRFDPGEYLLNKEPNEKKITIMKSTLVRSTFDLHQTYIRFGIERKEKQSEWIPLDPDIYLPYHYQLHRVPCTFEPVDGKHSKQQGARSSNQKKSKRKPKNK